jgi:MoaA/NifB/PqqE/SkfB family radical SAM enzyme
VKAAGIVLRGILDGRVVQGPQTIHLDVTNGCNTNCITCWDHSPLLAIERSSAWKRKRVDAAAIEAVLDDALSLGGLAAVILSGMGEPFTHPDVYRMIEAVKRRGLHLTIITNLVAADADRVLDLEVDQLLVGIHGASEASYRAFHPSFVGDEWRRLCGMLARFTAAGRRYKHVQVICATNAHEVVDMVELASRYDAAQLDYKLAGLKDGTEACRIDEAQRRRLMEELVPAAQARARALGVDTNLDVFADQLAAGGASTAAIETIGCYMGYVYARVLVDGTVLYCCNTETVIGSLAEHRFSELWNGTAWNDFRARMRRGDYLPSCDQCGKLNQNVKIARALRRRPNGS